MPSVAYPGKLTLAEDALAYLGVLVDCLQEWDRYSVGRRSILGGSLPLQGVEVRLGVDAGKVVVNFGSDRRAEKVGSALSDALLGWEQLVVLQG
jgi:hypothetical protein